MTWLAAAAALPATALAALAALRLADRRADRMERARLLGLQPPEPPLFAAEMVADLPDPARRFFLHAILPGTPLRTVAEIAMTGRLGLGTREAPGYVAMTAAETLAAPYGFLWATQGVRGLRRLSGSDTGGWTRFRVAGLVPVARLGGTDHARSAFGRMIGEAVFWTPAAVLPRPGTRWEAVDTDTARVTVTHGSLAQSVDVTVDGQGRATQVAFMRWSDANPDRTFRLQPFGGRLSMYRTFDGFRLPTHVEAGNHFGTDAWFPFFVADVKSVRFPGPC